MTERLITDNFVALVIKDSELIEIDDIKKIIDKLLEDKGFTPWHDMELELFDNHDETLIMARRYAIVSSAFCFVDFENMLDAVQNCCVTTDASLISYGGAYYLMLCQGAKKDVAILGEFCEQSYTDLSFIAHVKEHGKTLIGSIAIAKLQKNFSKYF